MTSTSNSLEISPDNIPNNISSDISKNYGFSFTKQNAGGLGAIIYMTCMAKHYADSNKLNFFLVEEGRRIPRFDGAIKDLLPKEEKEELLIKKEENKKEEYFLKEEYGPGVLLPGEDITKERDWHSYFQSLKFAPQKDIATIWQSCPNGFTNRKPDFFEGTRMEWYAKILQEVYCLQENIQQIVDDEVLKSGFLDSDIVIHIRRTDKIFAYEGSKIEQTVLNIETYFEETMEVISKQQLENPRIFLCTDDKEICLEMKRLFSTQNIELIWDERETSLHMQPLRLNNKLTTTQTREETITAIKNLEMFRRCRFLIGARASYFFRVGELIRYPKLSKNIKDSDAFGKANYAEDNEEIVRVNNVWGKGVELWNEKSYKNPLIENIDGIIEMNDLPKLLRDERIIVMENVFNEESLNIMRRDVGKFNHTWWVYTIRPGWRKEISDVNMNDVDLFHILKNVERKRKENYFCYRFKRTIGKHHDTCLCFSCKFRRTMLSKGMMDFLSRLVGEEVVQINETFASLYSQGDYLNTHHDKDKGDYTFIIGLTDNWLPEYGGSTNFFDKEKNVVYKKISPSFGTLVIFKLKPDNVKGLDTPFGRNERMDHYVEKVIAPANRISYTGWFNVKK